MPDKALLHGRSSIPITVPDKPRITHVANRTDTMLQFEWEHPIPNGRLEGYKVLSVVVVILVIVIEQKDMGNNCFTSCFKIIQTKNKKIQSYKNPK